MIFSHTSQGFFEGVTTVDVESLICWRQMLPSVHRNATEATTFGSNPNPNHNNDDIERHSSRRRVSSEERMTDSPFGESLSWWWWWTLLALLLILVVRAVIVLHTIHRHRCSLEHARPIRSLPAKTLVVLGSGGHTTEMLALLKNLDRSVYTPLIYMVASSDDTSLRRVKAVGGRQPDMIYKVPRSREVGQSYLTSITTTLYSFVVALCLVAKIRPNVLLCNGPGTCLPVAIATLLYRILGLCEGNLVFVESFCRVTSISLTGRLLYPLADLFVVHWDALQERYPNSHSVSTFVPNKMKQT